MDTNNHIQATRTQWKKEEKKLKSNMIEPKMKVIEKEDRMKEKWNRFHSI